MMYIWMRKKYQDRTVAELSIWHTIAVVTSFFAAFLLWFLIIDVLSRSGKIDIETLEIVSFFICLLLWLAFIVWLWIRMMRTAWKQGPERLGFGIFPLIQTVFVIMTILMIIPFGGLELLAEFMPVLLAIDIVVCILMFNFLLLAWCSRCRIPRGIYIQTASIIFMIAGQIWLMNR